MKKKVGAAKKGSDFMKRRSFERILLIVIVIIFGAITYIMVFNIEECQNFECFKNSMEKCRRAEYVNEEPEASWAYEIKGAENGLCEVNVKLLLAKKGELGVDRLAGYEMECFYPSGAGTYPEKDLEKCHGKLREELQQIIIEKLHAYIIENLGKIDREINSF